MRKNQSHILLIMVLLLSWIVLMNNWDNPYRRPIIGDAKGYYAYLPAIFIHHDLEFKFIEQVEHDYYPSDGSIAKDFLVEQPNGTFVNKCFPGASIFYLPFFLVAYFLSFLFGFPLDGYSVLFQWSLVAAHFVYYGLALILLNKVLLANRICFKYRFLSLFLLTFGSNVFYYNVFDFSVVHIFGLFGTALFVYYLQRWNEELRWLILGKLLVLLSLLLITRPTNVMVVLAVPLLVDLRKSLVFIKGNLSWKAVPYIYVLAAALLVSVPLVLWKWQTNHWLVYSYGDEKMDLLNPHWLQFLFSVLKGWWFWSPLMLLMFIGASIHFAQQNFLSGIYFGLSILGIAYVFSSWWIWTFGGGLGQRPMIDFYPIIVIGFAGFLQSFRRDFILMLLFVPLLVLNMIQAFQVNKYILVGGETNWTDYKAQFLQLKRPAPQAYVEKQWRKKSVFKSASSSSLDGQNHFSTAVEIDEIQGSSVLVVRLQVKGKHESASLALILSDLNGGYYQAQYLGNVLYRQARILEYRFDLPEQDNASWRVYLWNGGSDEKAFLDFIQVDVYELVEGRSVP